MKQNKMQQKNYAAPVIVYVHDKYKEALKGNEKDLFSIQKSKQTNK